MLGIVPVVEGLERLILTESWELLVSTQGEVVGYRTCEHGAKHACDELVDAVALGDQRYQCSHPALIVRARSEGGEDELLKGLDLILEIHEIRDRLISLVGVVDRLQADILLILECAVELGMITVEGELLD